MLNKRVESLSGGAFLLNSFSGDSDSNFVREVADTLVPDKLIKLRIDTDILGIHHFVD